jgi:fructokinase
MTTETLNCERKILVFGEILFDQIFPVGSLTPGDTILGGAPTNFAYHLQRSLGVPCQILSAVGQPNQDLLAKDALEQLRRAGLDTSLIQQNIFETGLVPVHLTAENTHTFDILRNRAYDHITFSDEARHAAEQAPLIYYGTLAQRNQTSADTLIKVLDAGKQAQKFCDINLRKDCYSNHSIFRSIKYADIVKLNNEEVPAVLDALSIVSGLAKPQMHQGEDALLESINKIFGPKTLVITQGEHGALAFSEQGEFFYHGGFEIQKGQLVDTIGSGDAFSAGFIKEFLAKKPIDECLALANKMGALVACERGAICPIDFNRTLSPRTSHYDQSIPHPARIIGLGSP